MLPKLNPRLPAAVKEFATWWNDRLVRLGDAEKVHSPLYHYTDARGLAGIINDQQVWFTSVSHLNDPSELLYGLDVAREVLLQKAATVGGAPKSLCERVEAELDMVRPGKIFGFFVGAFSRAGDDLGQWRAYADDGRGFAIGIAPHLFHTEEEREFKPNEAAFVANVIYDRLAVKSSLEEVLDRMVKLVQREEQAGSIGDPVQLEWFLGKLSVQLGVPILWHAHTTKHEAYRNEQETRLTIVNDLSKLSDYIEVRKRGMELVPFIRHPMPVRTRASIHEIVIGPSAPPSAEGIVRTLLMSHSLSEVPVRRSNIPHRAR